MRGESITSTFRPELELEREQSMFKTKLPYDYQRCMGSKCTVKNSCLRFLTIESDKNDTQFKILSYHYNLCTDDKYVYKIKEKDE